MSEHPEARGRRRAMLRTAMGPEIAAALTDPAVIEVMVNPDDRLRLDRLGEGGSRPIPGSAPRPLSGSSGWSLRMCGLRRMPAIRW